MNDAAADRVKLLVAEVAEVAEFVGGVAKVRVVNGSWFVLLHGLRNHRQDSVIELYRQIAATATGSYGLLHIHDDEAEDGSRWVCWTMLRCEVEASTEERLTPHFGRVEDVPSDSD